MYDVRKARCAECPKYLEYREKEPRRQHGTTMRPGCRYCLAGKRARLFKGKDPKIYVPKWCPRRVNPLVLRVYGQIEDAPHYHEVYTGGRRMTWPDAKGYALRFQGHTYNTGRFFFSIIQNREKEHYVNAAEIAEELSAPVSRGDVVEFDDGIKPMFYWLDYQRLRQIMFDRDQVEGYPPKND